MNSEKKFHSINTMENLQKKVLAETLKDIRYQSIKLGKVFSQSSILTLFQYFSVFWSYQGL